MLTADTEVAEQPTDKPLERRKGSRQKVELPITIGVAGDCQPGIVATTRNISSGGVCFFCKNPFPLGHEVEYIVTLAEGAAPVRICCTGHVIRCLPDASGSPGFEIAFTMDRYRFVRPGVSASDTDVH